MKAQISVEYLGTFGWIMLVVTVTVLALAQFGVLDLSSEFPEQCYLGEQIDCKKQYLDENGNLVLTVESKLNKDVEISSFKLEGYYVDVEECSSKELPSKEEINIICSVTDTPGGSPHIFVENRQQFDIVLEIIPEDSTNSYSIEGSIVSDVIAQDLSNSFSCESLTGGNGDTCEEKYQCSGNALSDEEYLGLGICCDSACVVNPCTVELGGVCCGASRCVALPGVTHQAHQECGILNCCESCDSGSSSSSSGGHFSET
jgi:hypothetical protein